MLDTQLREDGFTLEEIAAELGVSKERVRQIERTALRKCRRWCRRHGWRFEDLVPAEPGVDLAAMALPRKGEE